MLIFLTTFFISFMGSIHPGPLNISVIQTTLRKGLFAAILLAFGSVIPEIIYGYLAVEGVMIFEEHPAVFQGMQWAVIPILMGLGIQQIITSQRPKQVIKESKISGQIATKGVSTRGASTRGVSTRGFFLSFFNPQLLPYWIVILINYQDYDFLKIIDLTDKVFFVLGASLGAFTLNYLYAHIAHIQRERVFKYLNQNRFEQIVGWIFIVMGLLQGIKLIR